mgnify:CR=1 FL=1
MRNDLRQSSQAHRASARWSFDSVTFITNHKLKTNTFPEQGLLKFWSPDTFIVHNDYHGLILDHPGSSWSERIQQLNLSLGRQETHVVDEIWAYICVYFELLLPDFTGFRWCYNNSAFPPFVYNKIHHHFGLSSPRVCVKGTTIPTHEIRQSLELMSPRLGLEDESFVFPQHSWNRSRSRLSIAFILVRIASRCSGGSALPSLLLSR